MGTSGAQFWMVKLGMTIKHPRRKAASGWMNEFIFHWRFLARNINLVVNSANR